MKIVAILFVFSFLLSIGATDAQIPEYTGEMIIEICGGQPSFSDEEITDQEYVDFSSLDELGRAGPAMGCLGSGTPVGARSSIKQILPTGYQVIILDGVPGGYLFNRCHLIARRFQADGGDVAENLVTGTQAMNQAMAGVERKIAQYLAGDEGRRVLYRVTPWFLDDELICRGLEIEAQSMGDDEIRLHLFVFNVQPGLDIPYESSTERSAFHAPPEKTGAQAPEGWPILLQISRHPVHGQFVR